MTNRKYLLAVVLVGCTQAAELDDTEQALISDGNTGGTAGFFFLPPLGDAFTPTGTFDGSFRARLKVELADVDCSNLNQAGNVVRTFTNVQVYPSSQQYRIVVSVNTLGLVLGNCYRVRPTLDNAPLGFRDVQFTNGVAPAGYRKWNPGSNQAISFRLEDLDTDDDTILNHVDNCPTVANTSQTDADADGIGDACDVLDTDNDGVVDGSDNCPTTANADQANSDNDGLGDVCDACPLDNANDADGDGICGNVDVCPNDAANDADGDGICGDVDACPNDAANDVDGDGICGDVDACPNDAANDADGDGICGDVDACPNDAANDVDGDGICGDVDACPTDPTNDVDGDTVCGAVDNCPTVANTDQADTDGDGIGDVCELPCADVAGSVAGWSGDFTNADSIGSANLTNVGTPASGFSASSVVGTGAFAFAGGGYLRTPFVRTGAFTVSLWARATTATQAKQTGLFSTNEPQVYSPPSFQIDMDGVGNYRLQAGLNTLLLPFGAASTTAFQHLVVTYDGATTFQTYLDGAPVATGSWSLAPVTFAVAKIGVNRGNNLRFNGLIDDVRVFGRALSSSEVAAIHAAGDDGICP